MPRISLIENYDLSALTMDLYFDQGRTVIETTEALNRYLSEVRGMEDVSLSKSAVASWIRDRRAERSARTNEQIREWASDTVKSDLDTLEMLKAWHLSVWESSKDYKEKRIAAKDCVDVITTKLRIAQAADSGDKTEIFQIMKNEVNAIVNRNPLRDLLNDVADATRGLPSEQPKLDPDILPDEVA